MTKKLEVVSKGNGNINKLVGNVQDLTNCNPMQICKQILVNKHFRDIGKMAHNQSTEAQQEYEKVFRDSHNGWLS